MVIWPHIAILEGIHHNLFHWQSRLDNRSPGRLDRVVGLLELKYKGAECSMTESTREDDVTTS